MLRGKLVPESFGTTNDTLMGLGLKPDHPIRSQCSELWVDLITKYYEFKLVEPLTYKFER
jgi:hypothetical protein